MTTNNVTYPPVNYALIPYDDARKKEDRNFKILQVTLVVVDILIACSPLIITGVCVALAYFAYPTFSAIFTTNSFTQITFTLTAGSVVLLPTSCIALVVCAVFTVLGVVTPLQERGYILTKPKEGEPSLDTDEAVNKMASKLKHGTLSALYNDRVVSQSLPGLLYRKGFLNKNEKSYLFDKLETFRSGVRELHELDIDDPNRSAKVREIRDLSAEWEAYRANLTIFQ